MNSQEKRVEIQNRRIVPQIQMRIDSVIQGEPEGTRYIHFTLLGQPDRKAIGSGAMVTTPIEYANFFQVGQVIPLIR